MGGYSLGFMRPNLMIAIFRFLGNLGDLSSVAVAIAIFPITFYTIIGEPLSNIISTVADGSNPRRVRVYPSASILRLNRAIALPFMQTSQGLIAGFSVVYMLYYMYTYLRIPLSQVWVNYGACTSGER
jgi:hypothetical protein